jgi:serine protease Do
MKLQPGLFGCLAVLFIASLWGLRHQISISTPLESGKIATVSAPSSALKQADRQMPRSTAEILQVVNPAVVTVQSGTTQGSGVIVRSTGLVVTSKHLIEQNGDVQVQTASGQTYLGYVVDADLQSDLALVQLVNADRLPTIRLATRIDLKPGDRVYAIGSPAGRSGTLTAGRFQGVTSHGSLQMSPGLLREGNSGGPLLNQFGELVGVNKGVLTDQSGVATSVTAVEALLARRGGRVGE